MLQLLLLLLLLLLLVQLQQDEEEIERTTRTETERETLLMRCMRWLLFCSHGRQETHEETFNSRRTEMAEIKSLSSPFGVETPTLEETKIAVKAATSAAVPSSFSLEPGERRHKERRKERQRGAESSGRDKERQRQRETSERERDRDKQGDTLRREGQTERPTDRDIR